MRQIIKRFWLVICFVIIINIPILLVGIIRTNNTVTMKGDTTNIEKVVEIDTDYEQVGSFSSIYVISSDKITILQDWLLRLDKTATISEMQEEDLHFSDYENYMAGQVQKQASIMYSLIAAYNAAINKGENVFIEYSFKSIAVSYFPKNSQLQMADEIIKVNEISYLDGKEALLNECKQAAIGDTITVLRNGFEKDIILTTDLEFGGYYYYDINYDTINPGVVVKPTTTGGPSGGLLQALSIYNSLTEFDYTRGKKISGTGTMSVDGKVGIIGGVKQKIFTAFDDAIDIFFCPAENYEDALEAYNSVENKERMQLVRVETLEEALRYLENV